MRISNRKTQFRELKKPVLIVCEDSKSSVYYFEAKKRDLRINPVKVEVDGNSDSSPKSVVDYALKRKSEQRQIAKKQGIEDYEAVYCVMDVDNHSTLKQSIIKALDNKLIPIVSNECFELWYLLHFIDYSTSHIDRKEIWEKLKSFLGKNYDKADKKIFEVINAKGDEKKAIENAKKLKKAAENDSTERNPLRNPSTDVFQLVEKLNELANR